MDDSSYSEDECPECSGEMILDDDRGEMVCSECGLVIEDSESNREKSKGGSPNKEWAASESTENEDWTAFEPTEKPSDNTRQTTPPETTDEWEMWYPCPVCHSTELNQIAESHLSVSATEDGVYGGESSIE